MDKQQATREAFNNEALEWAAACAMSKPLDVCADLLDKAYEASQAALMPALVEARDALEMAEMRLNYQKRLCMREQGDDRRIQKIAEALARINAIIGSFPEGKRPLSCNETGDKK